MAGAADVLERVGLFQGFERDEIERIVARGQSRELADGAVIFREGEAGDGFYVVLAGTVGIVKRLPRLGEEGMALLQPGDFFGEMALIDDMPRSGSAVSRGASQVFVLPTADFMDLTYSDPALGCKVLWALCRTLSRRLRQTSERLVALLADSRAF